jgi:hypothetical protein
MRGVDIYYLGRLSAPGEQKAALRPRGRHRQGVPLSKWQLSAAERGDFTTLNGSTP